MSKDDPGDAIRLAAEYIDAYLEPFLELPAAARDIVASTFDDKNLDKKLEG